MNKLIIASAGAGKTTFIVKDALQKAFQGKRILITTFTEACESEIYQKIIDEYGCIPENIFIQTWFSFLISHGVKPYQGQLFSFDTKGMILVNGRSGLKFKGRFPVYWGEEENFEKFYFSSQRKIYSDKLAQLVIKCEIASKGKVFDRISRCFDVIYIDEVQDLAGYDLEVLDYLFKITTNITLVGDPRQAIYSTNNSRKNKKYVKSEIINFFEDSKLQIETDDTSLKVNYRCPQSICDYSNLLYPDLPKSNSENSQITGHDGLFLLSIKNLDKYLKKYNPLQLRDSIRTKVNEEYQALNFGKSKGLTLERVIIYPSGPMVKWLTNQDTLISKAARTKLYVALTRAKHSVAIVLKDKDIKKISNLPVYNFD
ncbi:UvrD-helicase domain-containing protein [Tenacibaculum sp.]|uniref:UvrD-helicase domain-containing protein n=1 Tax=Tenacibaculum sp. TaxID=1906242 RepID=UPI003AA85D1C